MSRARRASAWGVALGLTVLGCGSRSGLESLSGPGSTGGGGAAGGGVAASSGGGAGATAAAPLSRVDLLLVVDNSSSMLDKQGLFGSAITALLSRLVAPRCLDASGAATGEVVFAGERCTRGAPEFAPVEDLHAGIITTSLGAHGSDTCLNTYEDDHAQLLPWVRAPNPLFPYETWDDSGFLVWDPGLGAGHHSPPGEGKLQRLSSNFVNQLASAGENGCGFEGTLEAWYRFLIDPDPPTSIPTVADLAGFTQAMFPEDPAQNPILAQRARFLRDDSALVIVMLTDENDCSIVDEAQGWLVGKRRIAGEPFSLPPSTSACAENPNAPCCSSCLAAPAPGCPEPASDLACAAPKPAEGDNSNLRCFDQRRRFGFDLLYPLSRYLDGLTRERVPSRRLDARGQPQQVRNPIFPPGGRRREQVFLAGIVGVPWQDLATAESLAPDAPLEYLSGAELVAQDRWALLLGDPGDASRPPAPPADKLMFETPYDRTQLFGAAPHPLLGSAAALAPATSRVRSNVINGHEINNHDFADLQYACIFELAQPRRDCTSAGCDCRADELDYNRPICDGTTQRYAKAYPSVRPLRLLAELSRLGDTAIAASICPKALALDEADPAYGYGPAVSAIVRALTPALVKAAP